MLGVPAAVSINQVETDMIRLLLSDRRGIASIEYAILAVGIVGVLSVAMIAVGGDLTALWTDVEGLLQNAV